MPKTKMGLVACGVFWGPCCQKSKGGGRSREDLALIPYPTVQQCMHRDGRGLNGSRMPYSRYFASRLPDLTRRRAGRPPSMVMFRTVNSITHRYQAEYSRSTTILSLRSTFP